ncbi:hypothetical protein ACB092_11G233300 [Castanea dentata]
MGKWPLNSRAETTNHRPKSMSKGVKTKKQKSLWWSLCCLSFSLGLEISGSERRRAHSGHRSKKATMGPTPSSANDRSERKKRNAKTTIQSLEHDTLCMIFALLDFFDLVRCSAVCKYWNTIINKSKLLREFYAKQKQNSTDFSNKSTCSETSLKTYLEELAMEHHGFSLQEGLIDIDQWKGHSVGSWLYTSGR